MKPALTSKKYRYKQSDQFAARVYSNPNISTEFSYFFYI